MTLFNDLQTKQTRHAIFTKHSIEVYNWLLN